LDTANNTLQRASDLPQEYYFVSPSALIVSNHLYVVGLNTEAIFKYSMAGGEWDTVDSFL